MSTSHHSICIVVPYFGRLPKLFPLWLASCACNPDVHWLLVTDDRTAYDYPPNVTVEYSTLREMRATLSERLELPVLLEQSWDLTTFKPTYGLVFADRLAGFRWRGYCDLDVVFGSLRTFLTDEILDSHDKILWLGHLSLSRNEPAMTTAFRGETADGEVLYERAFTTREVALFDEDGMNRILEHQGKRIYRGVDFADFIQRSFLFRRLWLPGGPDPADGRQVFSWDDGRLFAHALTADGMDVRELLYIHFCRRPMVVRMASTQHVTRFTMIPNQFIDSPPTIDRDFILRHTRNRVYWAYWLPRLRPRRVVRKLLWQAGLVRQP